MASWLDNAQRGVYGVKEGVQIGGHDVGKLYLHEVRLIVQELALKTQRSPIEPSLDKTKGTVIPGQNGYFVDIEKTLDGIQNAEKNQLVEIKLDYIKPVHADKEIIDSKQVLSSFRTYVRGTSQRINNIELAIISINNTLLWPGEVFSFNKTVGPRTLERGFKPAPVIIGGEMEIDFGGGVCQTASTLYNAVMLAKLTVLERHPHSRPVHYVPEGQDAAVNYGSMDMRFANNTKGPIIIKASMNKGSLLVEIIGKGDKT